MFFTQQRGKVAMAQSHGSNEEQHNRLSCQTGLDRFLYTEYELLMQGVMGDNL